MSTGRVLAILLALLAGLETAAANDNARLHAPDVVNAARFAKPADPGNGSGLGQFTTFGRPPYRAIGGDYDANTQHGQRTAQQSRQQVIAPSMALRLALSYSPGSQGLDVTLRQGRRLVYAVKLKTGNRVHRVLIDAQTGQILGQ
jgi:hypothetical protein